MTDFDQDLFEAELRKLSPAPPPAELLARLAASVPPPEPQATAALPRAVPSSQPSTLNPQPFGRLLLRWLAPAAAAAAFIAALLLWWPQARHAPQQVKAIPTTPKPTPRPDEIEIDRQLVALFDTVARLPNGEPVRFRCQEWRDDIVLRDPASGLVIERREPRLEVVPVRVETF